MVSELAIEEIEALEARGVHVSPRDVVRLNAFGLKLQYRSDLEDWCACRRAARVGDFVFREPTLAHEAWIAEVSRFCDANDATTFFALHCYALTREACDLPPWDMLDEVVTSVQAFMAEAGALSRRQMMDAITFVTVGNDASSGEKEPASTSTEEKRATIDDGTPRAAVAGLFRNNRMTGNAIPLDDAFRMTRAEFMEAVESVRIARAMQGAGVRDDAKQEAAAKFYAVLEEIKAKAKAEGANDGRE